jgi:hypothetical protein
MPFTIKQRPTGLKKLILRTYREFDRPPSTALTHAWHPGCLAQRARFREHLEQAGIRLWTGGALQGHTVLVYAPRFGLGVPHEADWSRGIWPIWFGFGDLIHALRWLPVLADCGARIIFVGDEKLVRLLAGQSGVVEVLAAEDTLPPQLPAVDTGVLLADLQEHFNRACSAARPCGQCTPPVWPWLCVPDGITVQVPPVAPGISKIGFVWNAEASHLLSHNRCLPVAALVPLFQVPGLAWFSLQFDATPEEWITLRELCPSVVDLRPQLTDFAEMAAAVMAMDAIISMDTALPYLSSALAKRTVLLFPSPVGAEPAALPEWPGLTLIGCPALPYSWQKAYRAGLRNPAAVNELKWRQLLAMTAQAARFVREWINRPAAAS